MTVKEIYDIIDKVAPFSLQCSWDNSGILVGSGDKKASKILICLDITTGVVDFAKKKGVSLIISHHPIIFKGLKALDDKNPAVMLAKNGISAICCHTNVDRAECGLNEYLCEMLGFKKDDGVILGFDGGDGFGIVCDVDKDYSYEELALKAKDTLGCEFTRFTKGAGRIKKVGICTGSGGDFLYSAIAKGCDALITGDVKHNFFIDAKNSSFCLIDAGHHHTEKIFTSYMKELLEKGGISSEILTIDTIPYEVI